MKKACVNFVKRKGQLCGASGFVTRPGSARCEHSLHRQETREVGPEELRVVPRRGGRGEGPLLSPPTAWRPRRRAQTEDEARMSGTRRPCPGWHEEPGHSGEEKPIFSARNVLMLCL